MTTQQIVKRQKTGPVAGPATFNDDVTIQLTDSSKISLIPREAEMVEVSKTIKAPTSSKPPVTDASRPPSGPAEAAPSSSQSELTALSTTAPISCASSESSKDLIVKPDSSTAIIKQLKPKKDGRFPRSKEYWSSLKHFNEKFGTRRYIQFVIPVGPDPFVLLFRIPNSNEIIIPGGWLEADEDEIEGTERIWKELFQDETNKEVPITGDEVLQGVQFVQTIGKWYRPDFKVNVYPYKLTHVSQYKEIIKTVLVQLPNENKRLSFSSHYKGVFPIKLSQLYESRDPEISAIPRLLSKFTFENS